MPADGAVTAPAVFERVAIVGTGLIGGSVAAAVRERGLARSVVGFAPDAPQAQALGLIDTAAASLLAALDGADVTVLAAPVPVIAELMPTLAAALPAHGVLTDAGSTKGSIVAAARAGLGDALARYVPAHPIAGSERSGPSAANPQLFDGARVILSPLPETSDQALAAVSAFWTALGARIIEMPVDIHDDLLAAVSHLPHAVAFALALALARRPDANEASRLAGAGLRDTSRVAASSSQLWADILLDNRTALDAARSQFDAAWGALSEALVAGDRARVVALLDEASRWRRQL